MKQTMVVDGDENSDWLKRLANGRFQEQELRLSDTAIAQIVVDKAKKETGDDKEAA